MADRDVVQLAQRLGDAEHELAARPPAMIAEDGHTRALRAAARARVARDLELVSTALERVHRPAH